MDGSQPTNWGAPLLGLSIHLLAERHEEACQVTSNTLPASAPPPPLGAPYAAAHRFQSMPSGRQQPAAPFGGVGSSLMLFVLLFIIGYQQERQVKNALYGWDAV
jgi:hypothetical protein